MLVGKPTFDNFAKRTTYPNRGNIMNKYLIHLDASELVSHIHRLIERLGKLEKCPSNYRVNELRKALIAIQGIAIELVAEANR